MKKKTIISLALMFIALAIVLTAIAITFPTICEIPPKILSGFNTNITLTATLPISTISPTSQLPKTTSNEVKGRDLTNIVATRAPIMKNDLSLGFDLVEVQVATDPTTHVRLIYIVTFENISKNTFFVKKTEFGGLADFNSKLEIENASREHINFQVELIPDYTMDEAILGQDDFLELEPNEKISYECETPIPLVIDEERERKESLAPGEYDAYLAYFNHLVGYPVVVAPEEREYPGDFIAFIDLNAWVGKAYSNHTTFIMPDLSDYPAPEYSVTYSICNQ